MPQKAKSENKTIGRYTGTQLKQGPKASTVLGDKAQGSSNKGTEVNFEYSKTKLRG